MAYMRRNATTGSFSISLRRTGSLLTTNVPSATMQGISSSTHFLGRNFDPNFWWKGKLAWMASWDRALSDAEMTQMFDYAKAYLADRDGISL
jgi:hypothetical protein